MRNDCTIDAKQVLCKNASTIGYGKIRARVGDLIIARIGEQIVTARMIGRITYAPKIETGDPDIRNWICAIRLSHRLSSVSECWINPSDVMEVYHLDARTTDVVKGFLSADLRISAKRDVAEVRRALNDWSTLSGYRQWRKKLDADIAEYDARKQA